MDAQVQQKEVANYGSWTDGIDVDCVWAGNCKNIHELQCGKGSLSFRHVYSFTPVILYEPFSILNFFFRNFCGILP